MSDTARDQALAQIASITEMVAALNCDYDRLQELRDERADSSFPSRVLATNPDHTGGWWEDQFPAEAAELAELETAAGECADAEDAQRRIDEDPLSVEVRSGWGNPGEAMTAAEFRIVLCTGGPHVELIGELDDNSEPTTVRVIFKDWGEGGELHDFDRETVLTYCRQFYFGA